jgi:hypothetical protein
MHPTAAVRHGDSELQTRARAEALAARRAGRVGRLLDERVRTLGVDTDALAAQQAARRDAAQAAAAADREWAAAGEARAAAWDEALQRKAHTAAAAARATAGAWAQQVAGSTRRTTWDLDDPRARATSAPIRCDDVASGAPDRRLGPAGAQVFDGEDAARGARVAAQAAAQRAALDAQLAERRADAAASRADDV